MVDDTTILVRLGDSELTLANEADDVRGRTVFDRNGGEIGDVDGLIIDQEERKVRFLQVADGGFLGIGKQKVLVPVDAVTAVEDTIRIDQEREHVAGAPVYDPDLVRERTYFDDLYGYYGYTPFWGTNYMPPGHPYT